MRLKQKLDSGCLKFEKGCPDRSSYPKNLLKVFAMNVVFILYI